MRFTRSTVASAALAVVASGSALVPLAASAQARPVTDLQGALISAQTPGTSGFASYHASLLTNARQLKVQLKNVPAQPSSMVSIYVHGSLLTTAALSAKGTATINVSKGVPAMENGWRIQVRAGDAGISNATTAKVLCSGMLHLSPTTGTAVPTPGR